MTNWDKIIELLKEPEYVGVHKIYWPEMGFAFVTAPGRIRIKITEETPVTSVFHLLEELAMGNKLSRSYLEGKFKID